MASGVERTEKNPSKAWYLLPIFLGIIGGLIMYFVLRRDDTRMAQNGLLLGVILFIASIVIGAAIAFLGPSM